jgi:hypothetical protein
MPARHSASAAASSACLQLEEFDPEWETREKGECEALNLVGVAGGLEGWAGQAVQQQ